MNYEEMIAMARKRNFVMDEIDKRNGMAYPGCDDSPVGTVQDIRTAMLAIEAGITTSDWDCVAEAQVILDVLYLRLEASLRKKD